MPAKRFRPRRLKPGDLDALKGELWAAVRTASALLDHENVDTRLRAVHATAQASAAYRNLLADTELEAIVAALETRAEKAGL
jgi:hypothetical protein